MMKSIKILFTILLMGVFLIGIVDSKVAIVHINSDQIGGGNVSWNQSYANTLYVPYEGATGSVNLGNNNLTLGENLTISGNYPTAHFGNANLSFWGIAGQTFHFSNGVYIDGSVNPFLDVGSLLIVRTYAQVFQSLTVGTQLNVTQDINVGRNVTASGFNATQDVFIKDKDVYRWLYNQTIAVSFSNIFNQWLNTTNNVAFNNLTLNQDLILNSSKSKIRDNNDSINVYFEDGTLVVEG